MELGYKKKIGLPCTVYPFPEKLKLLQIFDTEKLKSLGKK